MTGLPIFKHLINKRTLSFLLLILNSKSPCVAAPLLHYYKTESSILYNIKKIFADIYNVNNILEYDLKELKSIIDYTQTTEPRSNYTYFT